MKRDEIIKIIQKESRYDTYGKAADAILSTLAEKFEVVEECPYIKHEAQVYPWNSACATCHGSHTRTRQATIDEVLEFATFYLKMAGHNLKSGGILRVKKA